MFGRRRSENNQPPSPPPSPRLTSGHSRRGLTVITAGLLIYALALIPFYFLTPVRDVLGILRQVEEVVPGVVPDLVEIARPVATPEPTRTSPARPSPTGASVLVLTSPVIPNLSEAERRVGAQAASIAGAVSAVVAAPVPTAPATDARYAILLLGYGGARHDGGYLTDSIMALIVDPDKKTLTLLSIPRDTWVPLIFDGKIAQYNKINTAYAFAKDSTLFPNRLARYDGPTGAGTFAMDTVSRLIGVPVRYYVALDFAGFRQAIDAIGGIDVDVPTGFAARYPANDDPTIDPSWMTVRFAGGRQHMGGERAIQYARARDVIDNSGEGGDFARARRQRVIIEAFKAKLLSPAGLLRLPQLLVIGSRHVDSNYAIPAVAQLTPLLLAWRDIGFYQTALTIDNYLTEGTGPQGTYVLVPRVEDRSWRQVRAFARRLWDDPEAGVAIANTEIVVVNSTGIPGAATRASELLAQLGYRVGTPVSGQTIGRSRAVDRTGGKAGSLVRQLEKDLRVSLRPGLEVSRAASNDLVIELGADDSDLGDLTVPSDPAAPSSIVGLIKAGVWQPSQSPAPATTPVPATTPAAAPIQGIPNAVTTALATVPAGTGTPAPNGTGQPLGTVTPATTALPAGTTTPGQSATTPTARATIERGTTGTPAAIGSPAPGATLTPTPRTPGQTPTVGTPTSSGTTPTPRGAATGVPTTTETSTAAGTPSGLTPTPRPGQSTATPRTTQSTPTVRVTQQPSPTPRSSTTPTTRPTITRTPTPRA